MTDKLESLPPEEALHIKCRKQAMGGEIVVPGLVLREEAHRQKRAEILEIEMPHEGAVIGAVPAISQCAPSKPQAVVFAFRQRVMHPLAMGDVYPVWTQIVLQGLQMRALHDALTRLAVHAVGPHSVKPGEQVIPIHMCRKQ